MKVIQISASDYGGGVETVVRMHHAELVRQNHDAQLLVARRKGNEEGIDKIPFRPGPKGLLRTANWVQRRTGLQNLYSPSFRAVEQYFRCEPDVIHLHSLHGAENYAELGFTRKLMRRYPTVITLHDYWLMTGHCGYPLDCGRWKSGCGSCPDLVRYPAIPRDGTRWNYARKKSMFRKSAIELIVPSEFLQSEVKKSPVLGHLPVTVVPNAIDQDSFRTGDGRKRRAEFGIGEDEFVVMMIANNLKNIYKGVDDGIEALRHVQSSRVSVVVVGRGADEIAAQVPMKTVGLPYTSSNAELASYYQLADLLLMPSRCETFGLVAGEAMACGTPVISFDAGALREVLGDDTTGITISPRSPELMARAIDAVVEDPARRRCMASAAVTRIRELFCLEKHSQSVVEVYRRATESLRRSQRHEDPQSVAE